MPFKLKHIFRAPVKILHETKKGMDKVIRESNRIIDQTGIPKHMGGDGKVGVGASAGRNSGVNVNVQPNRNSPTIGVGVTRDGAPAVFVNNVPVSDIRTSAPQISTAPRRSQTYNTKHSTSYIVKRFNGAIPMQAPQQQQQQQQQQTEPPQSQISNAVQSTPLAVIAKHFSMKAQQQQQVEPEKSSPPKSQKPKPKTFGDRFSDNLQNEFGIGKDAPFDMHKVPLNPYQVITRAGIVGMKSYVEHTYDKNKMHRLAKKGYGPHNKTAGDYALGNTAEDEPWEVCERDNVKVAVETAKKAGGSFITSLLITKNPYLSSASAAHGGLSGYMDEKVKQDEKMHECEKNKNPRL